MTTAPGSESDNKYFITDSHTELARLVEQERVIAMASGGLLPEHTDEAAFLAPFQRVLDVGCGPGGWALEIARAYPHLQVMGFDLDANMIEYANTQAQVGKLENVSFSVMDATKPLEYPDNFFDLVNSRYVAAFLSPTHWPIFVQELVRIIRPGGFIRLTEVEDDSVTTSPAFERMMVIFLQACRLGRLTFSPTGRSSGLSPKLGYFLRQAGCQSVRTHASIIDWSVGTDAYAPVAQDFKMFFRLLQTFMVAVGATTNEELEQLYQDIEIELRAEDFCALWTFYTAYGQKPALKP
jgi:ubiquinone/menaquinone biosynthesis C-methylase UbiE